ncbi:MAG TPA: hypothetical protein VGG26_04345 [Terracidiphilus sp.]|jgi:hypothetical protein
MQLWTEYEGVTIDGAFPLKKLLVPEGRSAFFSTTNSKGDPLFLRLIECHFDEEEILARWRSVEALGHPNFLKLERFGQLVIDGGTVVYTAFEKVDASLAEVLAQGRLSLADAVQLAASLISALEMLHINGFVHQHVEPRNIFAVGDVVKLRSDCVREAPEGEAGAEAKRRDVHDLAVVLLEALTQRRTLDALAAGYELPAPFDPIVRNGISGAWCLAEIHAVLQTALQASQRPSRSSSASASPSSRAAVPPAAAASAPPVRGGGRPADSAMDPVAGGAGVRRLSSGQTGAVDTPPQNAPVQDAHPRSTPARYPIHRPDRRHFQPEGGRREIPLLPGVENVRTLWLGAAVFVGVLVLAGWWFVAHLAHSHARNASHGAQTSLSTASAPSPAPYSANASAHPHPSNRLNRRGAPVPAVANLPARMNARAASAQSPGTRSQWRVIVFTYNHAEDAQKKSASIAQKHPELHPAIFTPSGRAPYLVTIGGIMNRDAAYALARRSRGSGLPRDTYAQNYASSR